MEPMILNTALKGLFEAKLRRSNNKAVKLGLKPAEFSYGATTEEHVASDTVGAYVTKDADGKHIHAALYTEVFLSGEAPTIDGYRLAAVVDLRGERPVVKAQPYSTVDLTKYHDTDSHCDHCGHSRHRKDVLVLENIETGETTQIGRSCAADFFRTSNIKALVSCSDWTEAYGNVTDTQGRAEPRVRIAHLFAQAAAVVRVFGWVNHKDVTYDNNLVSTKARVWANLFPWPMMPQKERVLITEEDEAEALVVMEWLNDRFLSKADADCSDFERNVKAVVEDADGPNPMIREKYLNYLIWGIAGYKRDLQKDAEERRRKAERAQMVDASSYVGTVGDRATFEKLTLTFRRVFGTQYGVKVMLKFLDQNDNLVVWWGTNDTALNMVVDEVYTLKATVKCHEVYQDVRQTLLTRAQVLEGKLDEEEGV